MSSLLKIVIGFISVLLTVGVATAKPVPVAHYSRLPAVYDAAISPDGNWLATVVDNGGEYILRVFNLENPNDNKTRATSYPDTVKINWVHWANNDQILLSVRQSEKMRNVVFTTGYLFVIDRDVTGAKMILKPDLGGGNIGSRTGRSGGFRQFNNTIIDFLPNDPDHILMSFGADDADRKSVV